MTSKEIGPSAFLDANVLRGKYTSDLVLSLATRKLFRPHWSREVLREVARNVPDEVNLDTWFDECRRRYPNAMVRGYGHRVATAAADPKDRHVLAAALHAQCDILVTNNVSDFWPDRRQIVVQTLDEFVHQLSRARRERVREAMLDMVRPYERPPQTLSELAAWLARVGDMPRTSAAVRAMADQERVGRLAPAHAPERRSRGRRTTNPAFGHHVRRRAEPGRGLQR